MVDERLRNLLILGQPFPVALDAIARRIDALGLSIEVRTDFWDLRYAHAAHAGSGAKTAPMYDLTFGPIPFDARWFAIVDRGGEIVATSAVRPYDWRGTNAKREIESGAAFTPFPDMQARGRCAVPAEAAEITGIVAHSGAMWVRKDHRGPRPDGSHLVRLLSETNRFWAADRWSVDWVWSVLDRDLAARGKVQAYGYTRAIPGTAIEWPGLAIRWGVLLMKPRAEIHADALAYGETKRPSETPALARTDVAA